MTESRSARKPPSPRKARKKRKAKEAAPPPPTEPAKIKARAAKPKGRSRREEDRLKMMFTSSSDPYDKPLRWWEQPVVRYAFAYSPVRSRLEQLMGSSVVRLTERRYMLKLMSRIRQEHETQQQARIQERKTRELMRTKKMILSRLIPVDEAPTEIREYPLFQLYLYCDSIMEKRRKKRVSKKVRVSRSLFKLLYPESADDSTQPCDSEDEDFGEEGEAEDVPMKEVLIDGVPTLVPMSKEEIEQAAKEKELADEISAGYMFTKEEYDNLHYEADAVKKLRDTRTVDEMYAKAHEIVGLLYSLAGSEKRRQCTINEESKPDDEVKA